MESKRTYSINNQAKTFAQLTRDEKIQLLRESMERTETIGFGKAPKDGWKDSDRVPVK